MNSFHVCEESYLEASCSTRNYLEGGPLASLPVFPCQWTCKTSWVTFQFSAFSSIMQFFCKSSRFCLLYFECFQFPLCGGYFQMLTCEVKRNFFIFILTSTTGSCVVLGIAFSINTAVSFLLLVCSCHSFDMLIDNN